MSARWWLDGRDDLRWWQHRHPDPRIRGAGLALMFVGAVQIAVGLALIVR